MTHAVLDDRVAVGVSGVRKPGKVRLNTSVEDHELPGEPVGQSPRRESASGRQVVTPRS